MSDRSTRRARSGKRPASENRKGEIDWSALRERLARTMLATQRDVQLTEEQAARLLEERAHALANAQAAAQEQEQTCEVAIFVLGAERYAIETRFVKQVIKRAQITPVPGAAELLCGVIIVQGELVPLFDARRLFGLGGLAAQPADSGWALILGEQAPDLGLLIDRTTEIARIATRAIVAPPPRSGRDGERLHRGVTADGLIMLHGDELLRDPRLILS